VVSIAHVDRSFVYQAAATSRASLKQVDVTQGHGRPSRSGSCDDTGMPTSPGRSLPDVAVGKQCGDPYSWRPFLRHCGRDAPEFPLSMLGRYRALKMRLASQGYLDLRDVPEAEMGDGIPWRIWNAIVKARPSRTPELLTFYATSSIPATTSTSRPFSSRSRSGSALNRMNSCHFQWSCHVEQSDGALTRHEFLDTTGRHPCSNA
jgi:hypothetical protein